MRKKTTHGVSEQAKEKLFLMIFFIPCIHKLMIIRMLMIVILLSCSIVNSFGCLGAYLHKLFPIGICPQGIVSAEMHFFRSGTGKEHDVTFWKIRSSLVIMDGDNKVIREIYRDSAQCTGNYTNKSQKLFDKMLSKASAIPGMTFTAPFYLSFCNYQSNCAVVSMKKDSTAGDIVLAFQNTSFRVPVLKDTSSSLARNLGTDQNGFDPNKLIRRLRIGSVRQYHAGDKILLVVHLQTGHELSMGWMDGAKEYPPEFPYNNLQKSFYKEPLLHHGLGFDVIILQ